MVDVTFGYGKRSEMLCGNIRRHSHAGGSGTGIFTGIRPNINPIQRKEKSEMGLSKNQTSQTQKGR